MNGKANIASDAQLRISADVLSQEVSGETVLLDLHSESYFGLDPVGTRIWNLLQDGQCAEEIVEVLSGEYEVDRATLEADVQNLLNQLLDAGLVKS